MAMNHNMTMATVRLIFFLKKRTNYKLQEKLETKSLGWLKVNTHTINIIKIQNSWT